MSLPAAPEKPGSWDEHGNRVLVLPVGVSENGEKVALLEPSANDDPRGPQYVEQEPIGGEARSGPDEHEHEQVEGMSDVAVSTSND